MRLFITISTLICLSGLADATDLSKDVSEYSDAGAHWVNARALTMDDCQLKLSRMKAQLNAANKVIVSGRECHSNYDNEFEATITFY